MVFASWIPFRLYLKRFLFFLNQFGLNFSLYTHWLWRFWLFGLFNKYLAKTLLRNCKVVFLFFGYFFRRKFFVINIVFWNVHFKQRLFLVLFFCWWYLVHIWLFIFKIQSKRTLNDWFFRLVFSIPLHFLII